MTLLHYENVSYTNATQLKILPHWSGVSLYHIGNDRCSWEVICMDVCLLWGPCAMKKIWKNLLSTLGSEKAAAKRQRMQKEWNTITKHLTNWDITQVCFLAAALRIFSWVLQKTYFLEELESTRMPTRVVSGDLAVSFLPQPREWSEISSWPADSEKEKVEVAFLNIFFAGHCTGYFAHALKLVLTMV